MYKEVHGLRYRGHFTCNHYMTQLKSGSDPRANEKLLELLAMTFQDLGWLKRYTVFTRIWNLIKPSYFKFLSYLFHKLIFLIIIQLEIVKTMTSTSDIPNHCGLYFFEFIFLQNCSAKDHGSCFTRNNLALITVDFAQKNTIWFPLS